MAEILSPADLDQIAMYVIAYEVVFIAVWSHSVWRWARFYDLQVRLRRAARQKPFQFQEVPWTPVNLGSVAVSAPGFIENDGNQVQPR